MTKQQIMYELTRLESFLKFECDNHEYLYRRLMQCEKQILILEERRTKLKDLLDPNSGRKKLIKILKLRVDKQLGT